MANTKGWILVMGVLALLAWGIYRLVRTVEQTVAQLTPLQGLSTEVARMLYPTPTLLPDPVTIVHQIQPLGRLETVQYTVEKIITAEENQGIWGPLFGDRLLFVAHGVVLAGLDLSKMGPEDVRLEQDTLYLRLPPPEIFLVALDNQKSYVYDRRKGLLTKGDIHLETEARKAAENAIREAALEDGILDLARKNGEAFLYRFLAPLGFSRIVFVYATPVPTTGAPPTTPP